MKTAGNLPGITISICMMSTTPITVISLSSPTSEQALESLLTRNEIPVSVVDEIKNVSGARAMYSPKDKVIYVVRSGKVPADDFLLR